MAVVGREVKELAQKIRKMPNETGLQSQAVYNCLKCGYQMTYIHQYQQWYCYNCHTYHQPAQQYQQPQTQQYIPPQPQQYTQPPVYSMGSQPKKQRNKKAIAFVIVILVVIASISLALIYIMYNPIPIDQNDFNFYNGYPTTPEEIIFINIESSTILWGNYTHDYASYIDLLTVHVTPTIQNISDGFKESYPDNPVLQAEAAYYFVAEEISYDDYGDYVAQYPVTTLQTRKGVCIDYASLLASLLYAEGLRDVAFVHTQGYVDSEGMNIGHVYVAVKIPSYAPPTNSVQEKIRDYLGDGWIGLDPTNDEWGGYNNFAELDSTHEHHWNITDIVGVPVYGAVFSFTIGDYYNIESYDDQLGYYFDIECELYAFEHDLDDDDDVTFTFQLKQDNITIDTEIINVSSEQEYFTSAHFELGYLEDFEIDDYLNTVEIYLIISP